MSGIVTLTSDFGTRDSYVAEMKGTILGIARQVQLIDVTHEIPPHDVLAGALTLGAVVEAFPAGTIHVAVVDPGVGTPRRALAVVVNDQVLVGPDNGLFTPFLARPGWRAFELSVPAYRRSRTSRTFHGRDVFAPAAAHLVCGVAPSRLGPRVEDPVRLAWPQAREVGGRVVGRVIHVDRFGNLVTSICAPDVQHVGAGATVRVAGRSLCLVGTYGDLGRGRAGALVGSGGRLEVAVREGSAARALRVRPGAPVVLSRRASRTRPPAGRRARQC